MSDRQAGRAAFEKALLQVEVARGNVALGGSPEERVELDAARARVLAIYEAATSDTMQTRIASLLAFWDGLDLVDPECGKPDMESQFMHELGQRINALRSDMAAPSTGD